MNRRELTQDIQAFVGGGFASKTQIARYLGKSRSREGIMEYLDGLPYIADGRGRKYFVQDVAERILEKRIKQ